MNQGASRCACAAAAARPACARARHLGRTSPYRTPPSSERSPCDAFQEQARKAAAEGDVEKLKGLVERGTDLKTLMIEAEVCAGGQAQPFILILSCGRSR